MPPAGASSPYPRAARWRPFTLPPRCPLAPVHPAPAMMPMPFPSSVVCLPTPLTPPTPPTPPSSFLPHRRGLFHASVVGQLPRPRYFFFYNPATTQLPSSRLLAGYASFPYCFFLQPGYRPVTQLSLARRLCLFPFGGFPYVSRERLLARCVVGGARALNLELNQLN